MTEAGDDLRATSEAITADAERLLRIEKRKRELAVGDPGLVALSHEAERLAHDLVPKTAAVRVVSEETVKVADQGALRDST